MTDRELLEAAAKAVGIYLEWDGPPEVWVPIRYLGKTYVSWNPLEDDGDALRLAVKLQMNIVITTHGASARVPDASPSRWADENCAAGDDYAVATRQAIVRAAAARVSTEWPITRT